MVSILMTDMAAAEAADRTVCASGCGLALIPLARRGAQVGKRNSDADGDRDPVRHRDVHAAQRVRRSQHLFQVWASSPAGLPGVTTMRIAWPLFVVSALLFLFGVGFAVLGAREAKRQPAAASAPVRAATPIATTKQIMAAITRPASDAVFQAVQTNVTEKGTEEIFPRNDEEWAALGAQAAALAESGNLIMAEGRAVDRGDWIKMSQAMIDAAKQTLQAVDKKNPEDVLASGETVNISCDNCHERYRRQ